MIDIGLQNAERIRLLFKSMPSVANRAMSLAINRALQSGKTAAVRAVTEEYTIKAKDVRKTLTIRRANKSALEGELKSSSRRPLLSSYSIKPFRETTGAARTPLRAAVRRDGYKSLGNAFIHNGIPLMRKGNESYPLKALYGRAPAETIANEVIAEQVRDRIAETVNKRFFHEVSRLLDAGK